MDLRLDASSALIREGLSPRTPASQFGWEWHSCRWCEGYRYSWVAPRANKLYIFPGHTQRISRCMRQPWWPLNDSPVLSMDRLARFQSCLWTADLRSAPAGVFVGAVRESPPSTITHVFWRAVREPPLPGNPRARVAGRRASGQLDAFQKYFAYPWATTILPVLTCLRLRC